MYKSLKVLGGVTTTLRLAAVTFLLSFVVVITIVGFMTSLWKVTEERREGRRKINVLLGPMVKRRVVGERLHELKGKVSRAGMALWESDDEEDILRSVADGLAQVGMVSRWVNGQRYMPEKDDPVKPQQGSLRLNAVVAAERAPPGNKSDSLFKAAEITTDAIVPIVNWGNPVRKITNRELSKKIFSKEVSNWNQLGGGDTPITLVLSKGRILSDFSLEDENRTGDGGILWFSSTEEVREVVAQNRGHIGLIPFRELNIEVKPLKLDGAASMFSSLKDENYPLVEQLAIYTQADNHKRLGGLVKRMVYEIDRAIQREEDRVLTLSAVGDVMLDRRVGEKIKKYGPKYPFLKVAELLRSADITLGNLECPISSKGEIVDRTLVNFRAHPKAVEGLAYAGFDIMNLANNHSMNYGGEALLETIELLKGKGINHTGAGRDITEARKPAIIEVKGVKVAFLGYNDIPPAWAKAEVGKPGITWADLSSLEEDVLGAKKEADLVVVTVHWGVEYRRNNVTEFQRKFAYLAIDSGASLVLGHHPHVLSGFEVYKGGLIAYSLGNFVFDYQEWVDPKMSVILSVELSKEGVVGMDLTPVHITDEQPVVAEGPFSFQTPSGEERVLAPGEEMIDQVHQMAMSLMD